MNRLNYINVIFMLASASLALFIPFELVLLSYAVLGPAHYLTEIRWLKDRQFFMPQKHDILLISAIILVCVLLRLPYVNMVYYTFGFSLVILITRDNFYRFIVLLILIAGGYFLLTNNLLRTVFGLYLPTLIHVYIFTGAFLLLGALKQKNVSGYIAFFTFLLCPALLCLLFTGLHTIPTHWAMSNYLHFRTLNVTSLRDPTINIYTNRASIILTRLIAFAYTYHYINWFSKVKIINWHHISIKWVVIILTIWIVSTGLYFYNYHLGVKWLFILSLIHVILEFPLNYRSFINIGKLLRYR
ncbi:MAG TPA: hypothetical protein VHA56_12780 [Mucilaginibacter sp.]|nr:hypothetical protein [Mucilaginibacter sp.]